MEAIIERWIRNWASDMGSIVEREIKAGIAPLAPYLRRLTLGVSLVLVSLSCWALGLIFLFMSLFFQISDLSQYVGAAAWTGVTGLVLGLLIALIGVSFLRKPR